MFGEKERVYTEGTEDTESTESEDLLVEVGDFFVEMGEGGF